MPVEEKSEQLKAFIASIIEDDELQENLERAGSVISVVRIAKRHGFTIAPEELLAASPMSFFVTNKEGIRLFTIDVT
jgi:predicted ribosomally synthesized peptide with nif11-like leader